MCRCIANRHLIKVSWHCTNIAIGFHPAYKRISYNISSKQLSKGQISLLTGLGKDHSNYISTILVQYKI